MYFFFVLTHAFTTFVARSSNHDAYQFPRADISLMILNLHEDNFERLEIGNMCGDVESQGGNDASRCTRFRN